MPPRGRKAAAQPQKGKKMEHKDIIISARLTQAEYAKLQTVLAETGLTTSELVRKLLNGCEVKQRRPQELGALYTEINRIGNNINQIARSVNAGIAKPEDARQAVFLLQKVHELVFALVNE